MAKKSDFPIVDFSQDELKEFHKLVGKNVGKIRRDKNFSQLDLSHLIGCSSVSLISGAEVSFKAVKFNLDHLYKIAKVLEVDICEFFKPIPQN